MFLITDGTLNVLTSCILVDSPKHVRASIDMFARETGTPINEICVNEVGGVIPRKLQEDMTPTTSLTKNTLTNNTMTAPQQSKQSPQQQKQAGGLLGKINAKLGMNVDGDDPSMQDPNKFSQQIDQTIQQNDDKENKLLDLKDFMSSIDRL